MLAKARVTQTGAGDTVDCFLKSAAATIESGSMMKGPALFATTLPLQAAMTTVGASTLLTVQCSVAIATGSTNNSSLIAIPSN